MIQELSEFREGENSFKLGNFEDAISCFESILIKKEYSPYFYLIYFKIGCCKYLIGHSLKNRLQMEGGRQYLIKAEALAEINFQFTHKESISNYIKDVENELEKLPK
jgi:tetratricopeptide (TPR) repeat protein